jgi:penicillin-binding protein 1A
MWFKRLLKIALIAIALIILFIGLFIGAVWIGIFGPLPTRAELTDITNEEASLVLSADGTIIGKFFAENRTNIKWKEVPEHLIEALIATEDKRFFEHEGIDGRSYLRVFFKSILMGDSRSGGGSTLTQQLIKNLYGRTDHHFLSLPVSKTKEAIIAYRMEEVLTKEEILLLYLNSVPFGEEVFGIEAASKRYFDKHAHELNIQESAVLVGVLKANTYYNPRLNPENALTRRNTVLTLMEREGFLSASESDSLKKRKLGLKYTNFRLESPAGYFVYQVKKRALDILEQEVNTNGEYYELEKDGLRIYTTMDIKLQQLANKAAHQQLSKMQPVLDRELSNRNARSSWEKIQQDAGNTGEDWNTNSRREILVAEGMVAREISKVDSLWHYHKMLNAAVLAADPNTGAVLAWTGGNNFRYLPYDMVLAKRQMASTIKPFIYAAALEEGYEVCDYFENEVREYREYDDWKPENYDGSETEKMKVSMWYALSQSLNLPTVDLYFKVGHEEIADLCRRFGLDAPYEKTPALSLGALDVSLYDLVKAYSAFANGGYLPDELVMINKITDAEGNILYESDETGKTRSASEAVTGQITGMLEMAINQGTGASIRNRFNVAADLAGKTGTAQDYSDAWFMVYTPDLVMGTWVGARSPQVHFNSGTGSGSSLALPVSGNIISNMEQQPAMQSRYLTYFQHNEATVLNPDCDAYREKGIGRIFRRTTKNEKQDSIRLEEQVVEDTTTKKKGKIRKFFDNIFKRKKKRK